MKRNTPFIILTVIFSVANIIDAVTALLGNSAYESNPIYLWTGSWVLTLIPKFGLMFFIWWICYKNNFTNQFAYFMFCLVVIYGTLFIGMGAASNIYAIHNEKSVTEAGLIPVANNGTGLAIYGIMVGILFLLPLIISGIAFWIYQKSEQTVQYKKKAVF